MITASIQTNRYWIGVVSKSHVTIGVKGGFAQLCHGKSAPLKKMKQDDWLIYYSPRTDFNLGEPLQAFTAIGQVSDNLVYEFAMTEDFVPFRRNIQYTSCKEISIRNLLDQLTFTKDNKNWGYSFRMGHFEINQEDFIMISQAMQAII
jgi:hypothetical protein